MTTSINNQTLFIHTGTGEYPLTLRAIRLANPNTSFPKEPTVELMSLFHYAIVKTVAKPAGDVVEEGTPELMPDQSYQQTFTVRAFTEEEAIADNAVKAAELETERTLRLAELRRVRDETIAIGAPIDFGGEYGIQHVQMRDGDRANILGLRIEAEAMVAAQSTGYTGLRTYENQRIPLTGEQVLSLAWLVLASYQATMAASWDIEDLIKASESIEEMPYIPPVIDRAVAVLAT